MIEVQIEPDQKNNKANIAPDPVAQRAYIQNRGFGKCNNPKAILEIIIPTFLKINPLKNISSTEPDTQDNKIMSKNPNLLIIGDKFCSNNSTAS